MLWMPITGYIEAIAVGHPPLLFNLIPTPALFPKDMELGAIAKKLHLMGQWLIYSLVVLHLAGIFYHVVIVRDKTLDRMLPEPRRDDA